MSFTQILASVAAGALTVSGNQVRVGGIVVDGDM